MHRAQTQTSASFASSQLAGQKRQRNRDPVSCQPCRARKVACDRQQPCGSCVKHKSPEKCNFTKTAETNGLDTHSDVDESSRSMAAPRPVPRDAPTKSNTLDSRLDRVERAIELLTSRIDTPSAVTSREDSHRNARTRSDAGDSAPRERELTNPYAAGSLAIKESDKVFYIGKSGWTMLHVDVGAPVPSSKVSFEF